MVSSLFLLSTLPLVLLVALRNPTTSSHTFLSPHNPLTPPPNDPSRVLLLTAHPDDECFFFAPTVLSLLRKGPTGQSSRNEVFSLCLSTGNANGLGEVRRDELSDSLDILGVEKENRWIVDRPDLQDNITVQWDPQTIAEVIRPYISQHNITTILTFDHRGISQHPNHISLPQGVAKFLASYPPSSSPRPRLYTLITLALLPKYSGLLAPVLAKFDLQIYRMVDGFFRWASWVLGVDVKRSKAGLEEGTRRDVGMPVFVSGVWEYLMALQAMHAHGSQLKWFRWFYVAFSRYMWVNEWVEDGVRVADEGVKW